MKAYLHESAKKKHGLYTYTTLYHIARHYGVSMTETPDDANVILVSVDSAHDFPSVRTARRIAGRRPLIAGGFECFAGEYLLSVCDALVVGEGFGSLAKQSRICLSAAAASFSSPARSRGVT